MFTVSIAPLTGSCGRPFATGRPPMNREIDLWTATLLCYVENNSAISAPAARELWCQGWLVEEIAKAGRVPVESVRAWLNFSTP